MASAPLVLELQVVVSWEPSSGFLQEQQGFGLLSRLSSPDAALLKGTENE